MEEPVSREHKERGRRWACWDVGKASSRWSLYRVRGSSFRPAPRFALLGPLALVTMQHLKGNIGSFLFSAPSVPICEPGGNDDVIVITSPREDSPERPRRQGRCHHRGSEGGEWPT